MYTTDAQKSKMILDIVLDEDERKNIRNFIVSRPDWNGGKIRMHAKRAKRLICLGYKVIQALDQTPRKRKKPEKMPQTLLL